MVVRSRHGCSFVGVFFFYGVILFTSYVHEFRLGWMLIGALLFFMWVLAVVLPLFWFYTIRIHARTDHDT